MAESQWTTTKLEPKEISLSISTAVNNAIAWRSFRVETDTQMYDKWIAGEISYDEVSSYFETRLSSALGLEKQSVEGQKLKATEKKQADDDLYVYNQFLMGYKNYGDFQSYFNSRLNNEAEDSPNRTTINDYLNLGQETNRTFEEADMKNKYDNGQLSYDTYKDFLTTRLANYGENSQRYTQINSQLLTIEPEYKMNQLSQLYTTGYWGEDYIQNLEGYQKSILDLMGTYGQGSPEQNAVFQNYSQVEETLQTAKYNQDISSASTFVSTQQSNWQSAQTILNNAAQNQDVNPAYYQWAQNNYQSALTNYQNSIAFYNQISGQSGQYPSAAPYQPNVPSALSGIANQPTSPYASPNQPPVVSPMTPPPTQFITPPAQPQQTAQQTAWQNFIQGKTDILGHNWVGYQAIPNPSVANQYQNIQQVGSTLWGYK